MNVDFSNHPLAVNNRRVRRISMLSKVAMLVALCIFFVGVMVSRKNQRVIIFHADGRLAIGELTDLTKQSPLMDAIARHYTDTLLSWSWRFKEGTVRPSHFAEIASPSGLSQVYQVRQHLADTLIKTGAEQRVDIESVEVKKSPVGFIVTTTGKLHIASPNHRPYTDAFLLEMDLKATYADELSEGGPGLFSFLQRKPKGVDLPYPFAISNLKFQWENLK